MDGKGGEGNERKGEEVKEREGKGRTPKLKVWLRRWMERKGKERVE